MRIWNPIKTLFWSVRPKAKAAVLASMLVASFLLGTLTPVRVRVIHHYHGVQLETPLRGSSSFLDYTLPLWEKEIARRFPDAYVVAVHGGDVAGQWVCQNPDNISELISTRSLAEKLVAKYPGREIVLLSCNPGHYHLNMPHVWHALDDVWFLPDEWNNEDRSADIAWVGNIWEFVNN